MEQKVEKIGTTFQTSFGSVLCISFDLRRFKMSRYFTKVAPLMKSRFMARCDADEDEEEPDLLKQADSILQGEKKKFSTPPTYENFSNVFNQARVNNYDGCRFIVQKQVNLNTQVSHFLWFGTAARPPMYQYRITIPQDEGTITVATDGDFNLEGEVNVPIPTEGKPWLGNMNLKSNFVLADAETGGTHWSVDLERQDSNSSQTLQHSITDKTTTFGYMQSIYPGLIAGGQIGYQHKGEEVARSVAASYTTGEHTAAVQWDQVLQALYIRKVNEGRAAIGAGLLVDPQGNANATLSAEFNLKTGKVAMSVDSNAVIKATLDHYVGNKEEDGNGQSQTIQLCAEMKQHANEYKFGIGFIMG